MPGGGVLGIGLDRLLQLLPNLVQIRLFFSQLLFGLGVRLPGLPGRRQGSKAHGGADHALPAFDDDGADVGPVQSPSLPELNPVRDEAGKIGPHLASGQVHLIATGGVLTSRNPGKGVHVVGVVARDAGIQKRGTRIRTQVEAELPSLEGMDLLPHRRVADQFHHDGLWDRTPVLGHHLAGEQHRSGHSPASHLSGPLAPDLLGRPVDISSAGLPARPFTVPPADGILLSVKQRSGQGQHHETCKESFSTHEASWHG